MIIKQISVFIENRSGRLAEVTSIIAEAGCSIRALSIADTTNFGILRLIVEETEKAEDALRKHGLAVSSTNVVSVRIEDKPGGLAKVLRLLSDNEFTVEYMYAFISKSDNEAQVVMHIDNALKADELLTKSGY
ncbi:MAG: ACT domain-containing protein [Eubacteriales bacterium]|nr:ACT domain-containing protein [Eubacteriales bacterium]MDD4474514.1 ACT domain-containing protein [Eubacteriales bacterium]